MKCNLDYIPEHLHANEKPLVEKFQIGEKLYYRCKVEECQKPYDNISLYDISHNRNFNDEDLFPPKDVLFNILEEDIRETYDDLEITELVIFELNDDMKFHKNIISIDDSSLNIEILLKHDPKPCMYPHSVFEVSLNAVVINKTNYNFLLNKKNRTYKNLRYDIRQELTSIIQSKRLDSGKETEFLTEP